MLRVCLALNVGDIGEVSVNVRWVDRTVVRQIVVVSFLE